MDHVYSFDLNPQDSQANTGSLGTFSCAKLRPAVAYALARALKTNYVSIYGLSIDLSGSVAVYQFHEIVHALFILPTASRPIHEY